MQDKQNRVVLHEGGRQIFKIKPEDRYFSIVPLDETLRGVTIENAKYPLCDALVRRAGMITISNEALGPEIAITIARGRALIVFTHD